MRFNGLVLILFLFTILSCSRQPVGVAANPGNATPAATAGEDVLRDPEIEEAEALREAGPISAGANGVQARGMGETDLSDARPPTRDALTRPGETREETNQTATIENQGSVGQAPLGGLDRPGSDVTPAETPYLTFQKSICYGDCEAYTFDLRTGGLASLLVDEGEIARGLYERELYSVDYDDLNNQLDSLRGMEFAPLYPVDQEIPSDIPYRRVTLPGVDGAPREIKVYFGAPPALERFMDRLEALISEQSWERSSEQPAGRNK